MPDDAHHETEQEPVTTLRPGITALLTAHPARLSNGLLTKALASVNEQTLQPASIVVVNDKERNGAGHTRREALAHVRTTHFAWLDSDDYWYPNHLQDLWTVMEQTGAKYVYSWFDAPNDPLGHFSKPFNPASPHHTTIVALVDTALAQEVGYADSEVGTYSNEDWSFITNFAALCVDRGYKMTHLAKKTWYWNQAGQNTSGLPTKGDAA